MRPLGHDHVQGAAVGEEGGDVEDGLVVAGAARGRDGGVGHERDGLRQRQEDRLPGAFGVGVEDLGELGGPSGRDATAMLGEQVESGPGRALRIRDPRLDGAHVEPAEGGGHEERPQHLRRRVEPESAVLAAGGARGADECSGALGGDSRVVAAEDRRPAHRRCDLTEALRVEHLDAPRPGAAGAKRRGVPVDVGLRRRREHRAGEVDDVVAHQGGLRGLRRGDETDDVAMRRVAVGAPHRADRGAAEPGAAIAHGEPFDREAPPC